MTAPATLQRLTLRAILAALKSNAPLIELVPAASIDPDGAPVWPFVLLTGARTTRLRASCVRGAVVRLDVHAFAGPRLSNGSEVETARDHVSRIAAAIETMLCETNLTLEDGSNCAITMSDTQTLTDGEPDALHWFAQLNCRVMPA